MNRIDATRYAKHIAVTTKQIAYVVCDPDPDAPDDCYHACDGFDADTYFSGCTIIAAYDEEGDPA